MAKAEATTKRAGLEFTKKQQISFPPYLKAEVGLSFVASPVARDIRDPKHHRYILIAAEDIPGTKTGPAADAQSAPVKAGETFSMSTYAALPLDFFMGLPEAIQITCVKTVPSQQPNDTFLWEVLTTDKCDAIIKKRRSDPNTVLPPGMTRPVQLSE